MKMKNTLLLSLLIGILLNASCQNKKVENSKNYFIKKLEKAENSKDTKQIEFVYDDNAVLYTDELPPIKGKIAIASIYSFMFTEQNTEFVKYAIDSTYEEQNKHIELGINIMKKAGKPTDTSEFKAVFQQKEGEYKITEIFFGKDENINLEIPKLLKPTGNYQIGQTTYYFDRTESKNNRTVAFQIWYPTQTTSNTKMVYQSEEVVKASADFLGFPLFMISYFSLIESNSFPNTPAYPNQKFPILLYNHGYGGFTSVYQTVFEDLASHGYIVVSIVHENESALFITENGKVITNSPDNKFYKSRTAELNGSKIGELQNIILNSNNTKENQEAYKELIKLSPLHNISTQLWANDTKMVIEKLKGLNITDVNLKESFDFKNIGVFGHSVGGATAGQLAFENNQIKAGINLDGFQFGDLINNKLKVPFMFVSSNQEGNRYLRALTFMDKSETDSYQVAIKGFSHSSFTDLEYFLQENSRMIELQRELIREFFDKFLKNTTTDLMALEKKYPELTISTINKDSTIILM